MDIDNDFNIDDSGMELPEFNPTSLSSDEFEHTSLDDMLHHIMSDDDIMNYDVHHIDSETNADFSHHEISFGAKYTESEIQKMEHDVEMAQHEMQCRENDMNNWRSKVSLNDTKEHRANGDYDNAVRHFNEAQSKYNSAVDRYNKALSKLNNAK